MMSCWRVRLSEPAESEFFAILRWMTEHFGKQQARVYDSTLLAALKVLIEGPGVLGSIARSELGPKISTLHIARNRRKGRHFILHRAHEVDQQIEVLPILHDSTDLARHIPPS
ncbi:Plasmid stabilization system protein [Thiorhodovibrio winogradskyi]|uniref:Plasmid stabilization system protein n=1 Tax=Thiorhodovibrio winogradskyi TaxID=77007 RepID=A0ABZ0S560_9GAMM|nr:type II toxin-antitoxin system RelE/ParE family toxin [Thiorhodovibrio winogradskyi]